MARRPRPSADDASGEKKTNTPLEVRRKACQLDLGASERATVFRKNRDDQFPRTIAKVSVYSAAYPRFAEIRTDEELYTKPEKQ